MAHVELDRLRELARQFIAAGSLPATTRPASVEGRQFSRGIRCELCGSFIWEDEFQYVVNISEPAWAAQSFGFHFLCHAAWQLEASAAERKPQ